MREQELNNLLDSVIGTKGNFRIPSFWMRKVFSALMEWAKGLDSNINVPTKISQLENDVDYSKLTDISIVPSQQTFLYLSPNQVTSQYVSSNRDITIVFEDKHRDNNEFVLKYSFRVFSVKEIGATIKFSDDITVLWKTDPPETILDGTSEYLFSFETCDGCLFYGDFKKIRRDFEYTIQVTTTTENESVQIFGDSAKVSYMIVDWEKVANPSKTHTFSTPGTHEIKLYSTSNNGLFYGTNPNSLKLPSGIDVIETDMLGSVRSLSNENIVLPASVKYIEEQFAWSGKFNDVYVPNVYDIANNAFRGCDANRFSGPLSVQGRFLVFGNQLKGMTNSVSGHVVLPDNVEYVLDDVLNMDDVTSIDFNNVREIGTYVSCSTYNNPTSITLGKNITYIGKYLLKNSNKCNALYCKATTPPTLSGTFSTKLPSSFKIYVPIDSVNAYKNATNWSTYANKIYGYNF